MAVYFHLPAIDDHSVHVDRYLYCFRSLLVLCLLPAEIEEVSVHYNQLSAYEMLWQLKSHN